MRSEKREHRKRIQLTRRIHCKFVRWPALLLAILFIALGSILIQAQTPTPLPSPSINDKKNGSSLNGPVDPPTDQDSSNARRRNSWLIAPIPINSPAFGAGLVVAVCYIFNFSGNDKLSPPSTVGAMAAFTDNGSRGVVAGGKLYFAENKYQTSFAVGKGRANYDFFGIGRVPGQPAVSVQIKQEGQFVFGEFMRNVWKGIFIGPRYQYRKLTASPGDNQTEGGFVIPEIDLVSTTAAVGFHIQRDRRNSTFYPTTGSLFDFKGDFFAKPLGSNRNYQAYSMSYNGYRSIGKRSVLAYRGVLCSVSDDTPFFDLCLYGARGDIRGYTAGEFQDHRMFAAQAEYRRELFWRFGATVFGGFGGIARHWNEFRSDKLLPGAGVGLRFKLDKANHINYRIDLGFGRTGHTLSFSVTEAF